MVDLDGVLCDFDQAYKDISGKDTYNHSKIEWPIVDSAGVDWWANMPWKKDGRELWEAVKGFNPTILSAPSRHKDSRTGKKIWVKRELGENVPLILENQKGKHADKDSLLIDDRLKNVEEFRKEGGLAILHKNTADTLHQLAQMVNL